MKWKNPSLKRLLKYKITLTHQMVLKKMFQTILKEFGVDSDSPDLFSSETESLSP